MKPIVTTPNDVLIKPAQPVERVDRKVKAIVENMVKTLVAADNPKGVGLAAPQIGISLRIFLMRPDEDGPIYTCVNPSIVKKSKTMIRGIPGSEDRLEGCLSIPKVWGMVKRHKWVSLKFLDETGIPHENKFEGFESIIVQHEIDHLDGILFSRRVLEQKGTLYKPTLNEEGKEVLEPIEI